MTENVVVLFDVDNTLLDNDHVQADLSAYLIASFGQDIRDRYFDIYDSLFKELGYADYLGVVQRLRIESIHDRRILTMAKWLLEYPYAERLYPGALEAVEFAKTWGHRSILSDGDGVFQPRKIMRSGLWDALGGEVLIYLHKELELEEIARIHPAQHYVMIDDKMRILDAMKKIWGDRLTTIFVRQGHYALDPKIVAAYPPADIAIERIGDLPSVQLRPSSV
jgi:FMN phosphatase YigB (HAD superfamily)